MTDIAPNVLKVASGATGASHSAVSKRFSGFVPGQFRYVSAFYKADRTTGTGLLTLRLRIQWYQADGTTSAGTTDTNVTIDADVTAYTFVEGRHTVPALAVSAEMQVIAIPAASPMQHDLYVASPRVGLTESSADVTAVVDCPATAEFHHSHDGVAESGEFPRSLSLKLIAAGGSITSGITWTYTVISGVVNGFDDTSGAQSISGSGSTTLSIASLGSDTGIIQIKAVYAGAQRVATITLTKVFAAPPETGGGGGGGSGSTQTSGFSDVNSASYAAISDTLSATTGPSQTQVNIGVNLGVTPLAVSPTGSSNLQWKVQRETSPGSGSWTDVGSVQNSGPDPRVSSDPETGTYYVGTVGSLVGTINDTGRSSSTTYNYRVVALQQTGSTNHRPFTLTGMISVAPA
jgi:hypothetical protein